MTVTQEQTQPSPQDLSSKELKALAKARRPWFMKKRFWALGIVGVIIAGSAMGGGSSKDDDSSSAAQSGSVATQPADGGQTQATGASKNDRLFPGRVDAQKEDQERNIGQSVELSGYTTSVSSAKFQQSLSMFEENGYLVLDVSILNRDKKAQSYNVFDWKLQTPNGQVVDPDFTTVDGALESGDLVSGGTASGKVVFEVGNQKGDFYVIYKPDAFDGARGIWKATV